MSSSSSASSVGVAVSAVGLTLAVLVYQISSLMEMPPMELLRTYVPILRGTEICRCLPGDECWPSTAEWTAFNRSLGGRLVKTIPIASVCHLDTHTAYDPKKCYELKDAWGLPSTHIDSSSSIMASFFANQSCDPFTADDDQCDIGSYVQYAVNATGPTDFQKTIDFVTKHNIRLTVRNTGHDYFGKSTGAGAVAIWTRYLRDIQVEQYTSEHYTGKALKVGAGVEVVEAYRAAQREGLVVAGGNCASVGIAGGYAQGGGHGPLSSRLGLAADQVLEWEVVTGKGELVTASPTKNPDLYWALSGGGGGTFGVVHSMTAKAYPDVPVAAANLTFTIQEGKTLGQFYSIIETYLTTLPAMLDEGAVSIWLLLPGMFLVAPTTAPGMSEARLREHMKPVFDKLAEHDMPYASHVAEFPTYLDSWNAMNMQYNISDFTMGGRLVPRKTLESNMKGLMEAIRAIAADGAIVSGVSWTSPLKPGQPANSINPAMRTSIFDAVIGLPYDKTNMAYNLEQQRLMTQNIIPKLTRITPNSGAYGSEADFRQPDWREAFYGSNYKRLRSIKEQYDPNGVFYTVTGVGSDAFRTKDDGRLCRV